MAQSTFNPLAGLPNGENYAELYPATYTSGANPLIQNPPSFKSSYKVGASEYGQGEKPIGSCNISSQNTYGFAELGMGKFLGDLPCGTKLRIRNPATGQSIIAEKIDIGAGGNPVGNLLRRIDLHYRTAQAIGFSGTGPVEIERVDARGKPTGQRLNASFSPGELLDPFNLKPFEKFGEQVEKNVPKLFENPFDPLVKKLDQFIKGFKGLFEFFNLLSTPEGWLRLGKIILGAILLLIAVAELAKVGSGYGGSSIPRKATDIGIGAATKGVL